MRKSTERSFAFCHGLAGSRLIEAWERWALPFASAAAAGGGDLPSSGTLLDVDLGAGALSSVRRVAGAVEARVWNPSPDAIPARVGGRELVLGPARIETVRP
jgi:hypothetical protein